MTVKGLGLSSQYTFPTPNTVLDVKKKIEKDHGFPAEEQTLAAGTRLLENGMVLAQAGLQEGSSLFLTVQNSGSKSPS